MAIRARSWSYTNKAGTTTTTTKYEVDYRDGQGKRRTKGGFERKKDAEAWERKTLREIEQGIYTADADTVTFGQAADYYWAGVDRRYEVLKEVSWNHWSTEKSHTKTVKEAFGAQLLTKCTSTMFQEWLDAERQAGKAPRSVQAYKWTVTQIIKAAVNREPPWLVRDPLRDRPLKARVRFEVQEFMQDADVHRTRELVEVRPERGSVFKQVNFRLIVGLIPITGLRPPSEILGLDWENCDFDKGLIYVTQCLSKGTSRLKAPKTEAGIRAIPMSEAAREMLLRHARDLRCEMTGPVLRDPRGRRLKHTMSWWWSRLMRTDPERFILPNGKSRFTLYDLRHYYASTLIRAGTDVATVSKYMGHTTPEFTLKFYVRAFHDNPAGRASVERISEQFRAPPVAGPAVSPGAMAAARASGMTAAQIAAKYNISVRAVGYYTSESRGENADLHKRVLLLAQAMPHWLQGRIAQELEISQQTVRDILLRQQPLRTIEVIEGSAETVEPDAASVQQPQLKLVG
jgi:integrase